MENINLFLKGADKIGVPKPDLFMTIDLFENKNFVQVIDSLFAFARCALSKYPNCGLEPLGPKLAQVNVRKFSAEKLEAGKWIPSQQTVK